MPPEFKVFNIQNESATRKPLSKAAENFMHIAKDLLLDEETEDPYRLLNERLSTAKIKEVEEATTLRVRLFVCSYSCDHWDKLNKTKTFFCGLPMVDYFEEQYCDVLYHLKHSKFIGYASVVLLIHRYPLLLDILKAIKGNKYMRYKSKLILLRYNHQFVYGSNVPSLLKREHINTSLTEIKNMLNKVNVFVPKASGICINLSGNAVACNKTSETFNFQMEDIGEIDNIILIQWFDQDSFTGRYGYALVLYAILMQPFVSFKQTVVETFKGSFVSSTCKADLYAYSINPALAIIVNNYYFTAPHDIRQGSERDVINLIRELKIAGIPYILTEDCNRQQLMKIFDYLETKDFSPLKSFLFFIMSHGHSNGIVYTHDGQLNIQTDVINRILANKTLKDVEKLLAIIKCRGNIDAEYANEDDLPEIPPTTDDRNLDRKTVILYSVPPEIKSPRDPKTGCPFIRSFCQHFRNISPTDNLRQLGKKIDNDLKDVDYFYGLTKCIEVVVRDQEQCHYILPEPVNVEKVLPMFQSIFQEFPLQEVNGASVCGGGGSSFVCSVLNGEKFKKEQIVCKYFARELDSDTFSIMSEI